MCYLYLQPARDENGTLDPYIKASFAGMLFKGRKSKQAQSEICEKTSHPQWWETMVCQAWLPAEVVLVPDVCVEVWDSDRSDTLGLDSDDVRPVNRTMPRVIELTLHPRYTVICCATVCGNGAAEHGISDHKTTGRGTGPTDTILA